MEDTKNDTNQIPFIPCSRSHFYIRIMKMNNIDISSWPVLIISNELNEPTAAGDWMRAIRDNLQSKQQCTVINSYSWEDAHEVISVREDLGTIIIDIDLRELTKASSNKITLKNLKVILKGLENPPTVMKLVDYIRSRNKTIPIILLNNCGSTRDIGNDLLSKIDSVTLKLNSNPPQYNAGKIKKSVQDYAESNIPPFFGALVSYVNGYNSSWHTPGHMGGQGFLRSPPGTAFHNFVGEDILRADLSVSVPELGSLLEHSGVTGDAEKNSARAFGADLTYYVLNGTTLSNEIVWKSKVRPQERTLMDRNCHKSLACSMIMTDANPSYMIPMRNGLGIMGPIDFNNIPKPEDKCKDDAKYVMSAVTNSTYDGICYRTDFVVNQLKNRVQNFHFDEAWFAYAKFHPLYNKHFAMDIKRLKSGTIYATQSTHKLLTAFSQAAMIHVKLPEKTIDKEETTDKKDGKQHFHDLFNETYMMYGSTSPNYGTIASLDVATKMMQVNGEVAWNDTIIEAIELRKKVKSIFNDNIERRKQVKSICKDNLSLDNDNIPLKDDDTPWFFDVWQPECIETVDITELTTHQEYWTLKPKEAWHGFENIQPDSVMLDPIKITFMCPGAKINGDYETYGIPATIVTNYLRTQGIVCEKSDYYTFLLLNSLGTTKGKQGTVLAKLTKFKQAYDNGALLKDIFPKLVTEFPKRYSYLKNEEGKILKSEMTLKDHCQEMHEEYKKSKFLEKLVNVFKNLPKMKLRPAEAYNKLVADEVEQVKVDDIISRKVKRTVATMLVPHPPGIPMIIGGEQIEGDNLRYLKDQQTLEETFPGYETDILGVQRSEPDEHGHKKFKIYLVKE